MSGDIERRARSAEKAIALWKALRKSKDGLTASAAAERKIASEVYARKAMRAWVAGGLARYEPSPFAGSAEPGRYFIVPDAPPMPPMVRANGEIAHRLPAAMQPAEMARIRRKLGLSLGGMGTALGWSGLQPARSRAMRHFEQGTRPIDENLADKIRALENPKS